jgi:hypothetical protein
MSDVAGTAWRVAEPGAPVQEVVLAASLVLRPSTGPPPNRND